MDHVMIDLETLGTSASSIILSIGAVKFDLQSNKIGDEAFYSALDIDDQFSAGRTLSQSTLCWWMQQSEEARRVFGESKEFLTEVLANLADWLADKQYQVWSNGADFDLPMLAHAYNSLGLQAPWNYANTRCFRTYKNLPGANKAKLPPRSGHHNALSDAVWQAQALQSYHATIFKK